MGYYSMNDADDSCPLCSLLRGTRKDGGCSKEGGTECVLRLALRAEVAEANRDAAEALLLDASEWFGGGDFPRPGPGDLRQRMHAHLVKRGLWPRKPCPPNWRTSFHTSFATDPSPKESNHELAH